MHARRHNPLHRRAILTCALATILAAIGAGSPLPHTAAAYITSDNDDATRDKSDEPPIEEPAAEEKRHAQHPIITFRLADGTRIRGTLTRWDHEAFDGSFGRHRWHQLKPEDVWRLHQELINRDDPRQWLSLGRTLLMMRLDQRDANRWAERAFHRARRLPPPERPEPPQPPQSPDEGDATRDKSDDGPAEDPPGGVFDVEAAIDAIYAEVEAIERDRARLRELERVRRLETRSPEARDWPATPWPRLSPDEQRSAIHAMRADGERILSDRGISTSPIEGSVFLLYTDLPREQAVQWLTLLESVNHRFSQFMRLPPRENLFWGKAVIMIFREQDRFRLANADGFGHFTPPETVGIAHAIGPRIFILLHRDAPERAFELELIRHTVLGLLHRHETPRRLPPWAAEGLAEYLANQVVDRRWHLEERRERALKFIREGGNLESLLALRYDDERWPARQPFVASVGSLMIELMHRERPQRLHAFLLAVKQGEDWDQALKAHYGTSRERLIEMTVRYYTVND